MVFELRHVALAAGLALGGGHGGSVTSILDDVDPLARLRTVRGRLAPQMEATAQVIAERVITLVIGAVDLNAMPQRAEGQLRRWPPRGCDVDT